MWSIVILGIIIIFHYVPNQWVFRRNVLTNILLIPAAINWVYCLFGAAQVNKFIPGNAAAVTQIVTTGVYAKVRHPIYSADVILAWGIFLFWPTLRVLVSVIWLTIVLVTWMKLEEKALTERFGDDYRRYKEKTPMFIPNYFKRG